MKKGDAIAIQNANDMNRQGSIVQNQDPIRSAVRFFPIWIDIFYSDFESNHQYSVVKIIF